MSSTRPQLDQNQGRSKKPSTGYSKSPAQQSPPSINMNRSTSPKQLTIRYQELCIKYKSLLEEVRDINHNYQIQHIEIQRLKQEKERDQKELYRLRSMIGFIKKEDRGVQINMDMQSAGSWSSKLEKSTVVDVLPEPDWTIKNPELTRIQRRKSPKQELMFNPTSYTKPSDLKYLELSEGPMESQQSRIKTDTIYSPKTNQKQLSTVLKIRESRQLQTKSKLLSNSPYSKLRFSRKI